LLNLIGQKHVILRLMFYLAEVVNSYFDNSSIISLGTTFFTTVDMTYSSCYILKVVAIVDQDKNDVAPITIDYIRNCEKYCT
jgi:hypothetical protein